MVIDDDVLFILLFTVYEEPPRDQYVPDQRDAPNIYDTPYEERRERTQVTENVTVEYRGGVESSLPPAEDDQNLPVLKDPNYRLPPGYGKPDEKKPINSIK